MGVLIPPSADTMFRRTSISEFYNDFYHRAGIRNVQLTPMVVKTVPGGMAQHEIGLMYSTQINTTYYARYIWQSGMWKIETHVMAVGSSHDAASLFLFGASPSLLPAHVSIFFIGVLLSVLVCAFASRGTASHQSRSLLLD